jgi:hypothetical protein
MTVNLKSLVVYGWLLALTVAVALPRSAPGPAPDVPEPPEAQAAAGGLALGKAYKPILAGAYAAGWEAAAAALDSGGSVADAQVALQETFQQARRQSFALKMVPALNRVLPEGTEPATPAQRKAVVGYWRAVAKGLRAAP